MNICLQPLSISSFCNDNKTHRYAVCLTTTKKCFTTCVSRLTAQAWIYTTDSGQNYCTFTHVTGPHAFCLYSTGTALVHSKGQSSHFHMIYLCSSPQSQHVQCSRGSMQLGIEHIHIYLYHLSFLSKMCQCVQKDTASHFLAKEDRGFERGEKEAMCVCLEQRKGAASFSVSEGPKAFSIKRQKFICASTVHSTTCSPPSEQWSL